MRSAEVNNITRRKDMQKHKQNKDKNLNKVLVVFFKRAVISNAQWKTALKEFYGGNTGMPTMKTLVIRFPYKSGPGH